MGKEQNFDPINNMLREGLIGLDIVSVPVKRMLKSLKPVGKYCVYKASSKVIRSLIPHG